MLGDLRLRGVYVGLRHAELGLRIVESPLVALELGTTVCKLALGLRARIGQLEDALLEICLTVQYSALGLLELRKRICELRGGVFELLLCLGPAVVVFGLSVCQLLLGIALDLSQAHGTEPHALDPVCHRIDACLIRIVAAHKIARSTYGHEHLGVGQLVGERLGRDEHVLLDHA